MGSSFSSTSSSTPVSSGSSSSKGKMDSGAASRIQSGADRNNSSSSYTTGFKQRAQRAAAYNDR